MIINKFHKTKIGGKNIKHYKNLGYNIKLYNIIVVPTYQLPKGSHVKIDVRCDYCGKIVSKIYKSLWNERKKSFTKKDCCKNCIYKKTTETLKAIYGVTNCMSLESTKIKMKDTCLKKYGVEFAIQDLGIKTKAGNAQKNMSEEKKKLRRLKTEKTMMKKYGVKYALQVDKCRKNLFKTRSSASSQQITIYNLIKKEYGEKNITPNFYYSKLCLDMLAYINNIKIDVEYDSWYWHEFKRDRKRDEFLKSRGFKILRIKSGKKIPPKKILFEKINELATTDLIYSEIILDDWNEKEYKKGGRR